jgi:hypothetical protein
MKTKLEIIDETVEYYKTHNRGIQKNSDCLDSCVYINEDGDKCAVGRCLVSPTADWIGDVFDVFSDSETLNKRLLPEYQGHDIHFWKDIQCLHDVHSNWENGITPYGLHNISMLKEKYK